MPAKPLTAEQKADAGRLKVKFLEWQATQKSQKLPWSQDWASEKLGFGQSATNQYLNGKIPLNAEAANKFANFLGCGISEISETLFMEISGLAQSLDVRREAPHFVAEPQVRYLAEKRPSAVILQLAELLLPMDETDRKMCGAILADLVNNPSKGEQMAAKFERVLEGDPDIEIPSAHRFGA